jgi:hypothetical protein
MQTPSHDDISRRAFHLWEREGRPEGKDKDHWWRAERELQGAEPNHTIKDNKGQTRPGDEGRAEKFVHATPGSSQRASQVEGEGSYTAAQRYREGVEKTVKSGKVEENATAAKKALEGPEGDQLREAEERGRKG